MSGHTSSPVPYYAVFAGLIALTALTVLLGYVELGPWHTPVGLAIAAGKAVLVIVFFMHLLTTNRLSWLALAAGFFWLAILILMTLSEYLTRHLLAY
jgi:cytochrome c oxidase subunit 4